MDAAPVAAPPRGRRRYDPAWSDWNQPRRWPGVLLTTAVVLVFFGVLIWHFQPHATPAKKTWQPPPQSHFNAAMVPGIVGHETLYTFRGVGNRTGLRFDTDGQLLVMHAACQCQFNFVVELSSSIDQPIAFPVNTNGHYDAVLNSTLAPGQYSLSVVGTGPWFVQLIEPSAQTPSIDTPFKYLSAGDDVLGPFSSANKALNLRFLSGTNGSIYIHVLSGAGQRIATPFEARFAVIGNINLSKITDLPNPYYLEVDASGYWQLIVRRSAGT